MWKIEVWRITEDMRLPLFFLRIQLSIRPRDSRRISALSYPEVLAWSCWIKYLRPNTVYLILLYYIMIWQNHHNRWLTKMTFDVLYLVIFIAEWSRMHAIFCPRPDSKNASTRTTLPPKKYALVFLGYLPETKLDIFTICCLKWGRKAWCFPIVAVFREFFTYASLKLGYCSPTFGCNYFCCCRFGLSDMSDFTTDALLLGFYYGL